MISLLILTIALSAPLSLAAMGGYASERAGVMNIGLEGLMLIAAVTTALASIAYGPWLGPLFGLGAAVLLSLVHWLATQIYRIDQVISGMAINLIALGASTFLWQRFGNGGATVPDLPESLIYAVAMLLPIGLWAYAKFTRGGLRLTAVGGDPTKARLMGIEPRVIRFWALLATGIFAGLGGASLVAYTGVFTDNMTAGKGFIALAALIVGGWRPLPTLAVCIAFGFLSSLQLYFQGGAIPSQAWASLPYLATVIALAGFLGKHRTPAGLGKP